jgi:phage terminase large subunit
MEHHRYKSFYGSRGGAKSWAFARALLCIAATQKIRVLCTREFQSSIAESVHKLLCIQIEQLGLQEYYTIQKNSIVSSCGSEFIFKGLCFNIQEIKSLEDIDICWVEEAQSTSEESWQVLIPTIRKEGSEIWLSWNTGEVKDPTYQRFVVSPPPDCISIKVGWRDNKYFPETLRKEKDYCQLVDPDAYDHIWEGNPRSISNACIFKGKFEVLEFETSYLAKFRFGSDWGFSNDPTTLVRSYIEDNCLWIDYEAYAVGVDYDEIPELFDDIPESRKHLIRADCARPDTIKYIKKKGFIIRGANKAGRIKPTDTSIKPSAGSIKEGIAFLRKFRKIYIHQRCKHTIEEFKLYSYKTDRKTGEVLPIVIDKNNHIIDPLRYSYDDEIKGGTNWLKVVNG